MARKIKQDESTYKSSVFGTPLARVLIVLIVVLFIVAIFADDIFKMFSANTSAGPSYVRVNGKELFVRQDAGNTYSMTSEANSIVYRLAGWVEQNLSSVDPSQFSFFKSYADMLFKRLVEELTETEMYRQLSEKVGMAIPEKAFFRYATSERNKIIEKIQSDETSRELEPVGIDEFKGILEKDYRQNNVKKPLTEGFLISTVDIRHAHRVKDTKSKIKYAFYGFNDYIRDIVNETQIEEEKLKEFLKDNPNQKITTSIVTEILVFDTKDEAEKALMETDPFITDEYKSKLLPQPIEVKKDSGNFETLLNTAKGSIKRAVLNFGAKFGIFKVKDIIQTDSYDEILQYNSLDDLKSKYITQNSDQYIAEFKTKAEKKMVDFKKAIEGGKNFFELAKEMNLKIVGETEEISLGAEAPVANENAPVKLDPDTKSIHNDALRKANKNESFVNYVFTTKVDGVSDVYFTSDNHELNLFDKTDYYYIISPIEINLDEELTQARETTISDELRTEIKDDFTSLKKADLKRQNSIEINYDKIMTISQIQSLFKAFEPQESLIDTSGIGTPIDTGTETTTDTGTSTGLGTDTGLGIGLGDTKPLIDLSDLPSEKESTDGTTTDGSTDGN